MAPSKKSVAKNPLSRRSKRSRRTDLSKTVCRTTSNAANPNAATSTAATSTAATSAVFNTTELLEAILLHLGPADLIRVRQAGVRFRNVIMRCSSLRRAIFLRASSDEVCGEPVMRDPLYIPIPRYFDRDPQPDAPTILTLLRRNPFVFTTPTAALCPGSLSLRSRFEDYVTKNIYHLAINYMHLTNPPVNEVYVALGNAENGDKRCNFAERRHVRVTGAGVNCSHLSTFTLTVAHGELRVLHLVRALRQRLKTKLPNGELKYVIRNCLVVLPRPYELVQDEKDEEDGSDANVMEEVEE